MFVKSRLRTPARFQPTYEELKLDTLLQRISKTAWFSAYLRGIETTINNDSLSWNNGVFSLPTRN